MARRRFIRRGRSFPRRNFGGFARRAFRRGRRYGRRSGIGLIKNPVYYAGVAVGAFTEFDDKHEDVIHAIGTMPLTYRGKGGIGQFVKLAKMACQGATFGESATKLLGVNAKTESYGMSLVSRFRR